MMVDKRTIKDNPLYYSRGGMSGYNIGADGTVTAKEKVLQPVVHTIVTKADILAEHPEMNDSYIPDDDIEDNVIRPKDFLDVDDLTHIPATQQAIDTDILANDDGIIEPLAGAVDTYNDIVKKSWTDYDFGMTLPFTEEELLKGNFLGNSNYIKLDGCYNFYDAAYEAFLARDTLLDIVPERAIPHVYMVSKAASLIASDDKLQSVTAATLGKIASAVDVAKQNVRPSVAIEDQDSQFVRLATLGGSLDKETIVKSIQDSKSNSTNRRMGGSTGGTKTGLSKGDASSYFTDMSKALTSGKAKSKNAFEAVRELAEKQKNIIISGLYEEEYYRYAPMYFLLEFATDTKRVFANLLAESNYLKHFIVDVIDAFNVNDMSSRDRLTFEREFEETRQWLYQEYPGAELNYDNEIAVYKRRCFGVSKWLEGITGDDVNEDKRNQRRATDSTVDNKSLFIGSNFDKLKRDLTSQRKLFYDAIAKLIFTSKLDKFVMENMRSYEEVMAGKQAYSETVFYKVSKYKGKVVPTDEEPIQNVYIVNDGTAEDMMEKYVDNQVKYGQYYSYEIKAYRLVIGTEYSYKDYLHTDNVVTLRTEFSPSLIIVEEPYEEVTGGLSNITPVFPDLEIVPFRRINDEVKLMLSPGVGSYYDYPIAIQEGDEQKIEDIMNHQKLMLDDYVGKLNFVSDDPASFYQIFRLARKPNSYQDFSGALLTTLLRNTSTKQTRMSYNDAVKPNTKYWYMVRAIDIHGHLSNPSLIYELELIDTDGIVYAVIKPFEFEKPATDSVFWTFKSDMKIKPTFAQGMLNENKTNAFYLREKAVGNTKEEVAENRKKAAFDYLETSGKMKQINQIVKKRELAANRKSRVSSKESLLDVRNSKKGIENINSATDFSKVFLSAETTPVWGKRFKVRLRSRSTGRTIDINFACSTVFTKGDEQ